MFAIVDIAGFQERVRKGDTLRIPLTETEAGKTLQFDRVLLLATSDVVTVGMPYISGASVAAKVLSHGKEEKIRVVKAHRRKRYRRVHGHRQAYTEVEVTDIRVQ